MTLTDLSHDQQMALVALVEAVAMANGIVSEGELKGIGKIVEQLGEEQYRGLMTEADERFGSLDDLKNLLATIEDQSAREIIYGTVWEASVSDPDVNHTETELLDWLKNAWQIG